MVGIGIGLVDTAGMRPGRDLAVPAITSTNTASVAENATLAKSLTANEAVTWSIVGGADQAQFEISGSTLRWSSNGTRDYESPADANADNAYVVAVRATDAAGNTSDQTITVTVTDVVEGPAFVSATGYVTGTSNAASWTPFTGLDLSNCDLAIFILSRDGSGTDADSTASSGWAPLTFYSDVLNDQLFVTLFAKLNPGASEELVITFEGGTSEQGSGILIRASGVDGYTSSEAAGNGSSANADPSEVFADAGAVDHLWIAFACFDNIVTATAAPSGYSNLTTQAASGSGGASCAIATKTGTNDPEDPGAFTSATEQWVAGTIACYPA